MPKKRHQGLEASIPNIIALERYKNVQFNMTMRSHFLGMFVLQMTLLKRFIEEPSEWTEVIVIAYLPSVLSLNRQRIDQQTKWDQFILYHNNKS